MRDSLFAAVPEVSPPATFCLRFQRTNEFPNSFLARLQRAVGNNVRALRALNPDLRHQHQIAPLGIGINQLYKGVLDRRFVAAAAESNRLAEFVVVVIEKLFGHEVSRTTRVR